MQRKLPLALACAAALALLPSPALRAQESATAAEKTEVPEATYRLKKVSLSLYGGTFSGGTFFELPKPWDRTEVAEGVDEVFSYAGTPFTTLDRRFYSAPRKRIEPGTQFGGKIGFYLSEQFHLDLQLAMAASKATTTFMYDNPHTAVADPIRVQVDEDPNFKSLMGGGGLAYDGRSLSVLGVTPYVGCGFGGIINRFSHLKDKTALYFQFAMGLYHDVTPKLRLSANFTATTFSFQREELNYGKQVTYTNAAVGISYLIDMIPRD